MPQYYIRWEFRETWLVEAADIAAVREAARLDIEARTDAASSVDETDLVEVVTAAPTDGLHRYSVPDAVVVGRRLAAAGDLDAIAERARLKRMEDSGE